MQSGSNFWVCVKTLRGTIQMKATEQFFTVNTTVFVLYKMVQIFKSVWKP